MARYTRKDIEHCLELVNREHERLSLPTIGLSIWSPGDRLGTRYQCTSEDGARVHGHVMHGASECYSTLYTHYCLLISRGA